MDGPDKGELVPDDVSARDLREECNSRMHRAGYCRRDGGPRPRKILTTCPIGERRLNIWPRDAAGNLI